MHFFEYQLAAAAVFHQRVTLAHAHPVDAFAQVVHILEVLHPEVVLDVRSLVGLAVDLNEPECIRYDVVTRLREGHFCPGFPLGDRPGDHH